MRDIAALSAGLAVLITPGILLWRTVFFEDDFVDRLTWGSTASLAIAVLVAFYASLYRISFFWPLWIAVFAFAAVLAIVLRPLKRVAARDGKELWLGVVLLVVGVSRFLPTFFHSIPPGFDPSLHSLLAKKLMLSDRFVSDFSPFENIAVTYPLGSHFLLVVLSRATSMPLHRVFQLLLPALGVITTAQIYALARTVFRSSEIALYSAVAYGMWAFLGSIGYYTWGGLPNELGMMFLIAANALLFRRSSDMRSAGALAIFLSGAFLTHHQVTVVAVIIFTVAAAYLWLQPQVAQWANSIKLRVLVAGVAGAVLMTAAYMIPEAQKLGRIGQTDALRFQTSHTIFALVANMGLIFLVAAVVGFIASGREKTSEQIGMLRAICIALTAAYLVSGPLYSAFARYRWGDERTALEPTRFVTDLVYFLSLYAGFAIYRLTARLRMPPGKTVGLALLLALSNISLWRGTFVAGNDNDLWHAYEWIQQHTPPDAVVLTNDSWAAYATWRPTLNTPYNPASPHRGENSARRAAAALAAGRAPEVSEVLTIVAPRGKWDRGSVVWHSPSGWLVVRQWPDRSPTATATR